MMNTYVFRVDSSEKMGTGHVMRCLALASELQHRGHSVFFICRKLKGNLISHIEASGFKVVTLPSPASSVQTWLEVDINQDIDETIEALNSIEKTDWIIVDHYGINSDWEESVSNKVKKIFVIEDLTSRSHYCQLMLNQHTISDLTQTYKDKITRECEFLFGPKYALLRNDFNQLHKKVKNKTIKEAKDIFVFFGGIDATNETHKTLEAIKLLNNENLKIHCLIGKNNPHFASIERTAFSMQQVTLYQQLLQPESLMTKCDIAIGAGGVTTWERLCIGLPTLAISVADNQIKALEELDQQGYIRYLGQSKSVNADTLASEISEFISNPTSLNEMMKKGLHLVDGLGVSRVCEKLK